MSLAPAEQERGTVKEPGSNHHEPHWSQSPPWFLELYQSRWEPGRAHTERKWAVSSFFLIPPRITSFQSLNQYCQRTAVHPTRNTLLTITLFREIITHAHTHVKIIYSLFFISQTRTIKGVLFFFLRRHVSALYGKSLLRKNRCSIKLEFGCPEFTNQKRKYCGRDPRP